MDPPTKQIKGDEKPSARVTVLDAVEFDTEIHRVLKEKLLDIFHTLSPSFTKWEPELDTILRLVLWKLSVNRLQATFGQQLLKVKYSKEISQSRIATWAVLNIGARYLKQRSMEIVNLLARPTYKDQMVQAVGWVELFTQLASLLNLLLFLRQGRYPTLADRLAGTRPVAVDSRGSRVIGYSFMTRELLWHGFIELIVFALPLVNMASLQRRLRKWVGQRKPVVATQQPLVLTIATRCAVCQQPPTLPHHMGCSHVFCYYCLQSNRIADSKFECPRCGYATEDSANVEPVRIQFCKNS